MRLYLIEILHQTTTTLLRQTTILSCILSKFYIKPQRNDVRFGSRGVVSYRNSTSNHNLRKYNDKNQKLYLIEILHQTTTWSAAFGFLLSLYLIEILHQTTTTAVKSELLSLLYLIEILHQTTTYIQCESILLSCILSKFYIKPQLLLVY